MDANELAQILVQHRAWLDKSEGFRADLYEADLHDADLRRADLRDMDLRGADLRGADLRGADLREADLCGICSCESDLRGANLRRANLCKADLRDANLSWANLREANLREADLRRANLNEADLRDANLSWANLCKADLREANLRGANLNEADLYGASLRGSVGLSPLAAARLEILPRLGEVYGWKQCCNGVLVELVVPMGVERSNASGRKCRARRVRVVAIHGGDVGVSLHDSRTIYRVGEDIECDRWDADRWVECGGGIHFYLAREEAEANS